MALRIHQKSVYLILFNATMIARSLGKSFSSNKRTLRSFKIVLFRKLDGLLWRLDRGTLKSEHVTYAIRSLAKQFRVSFGQSQKAINVILKYHYYLMPKRQKCVGRELHCPLDSVILKAIGHSGISLARLDETKYKQFQNEIANKSVTRIAFDSRWDKQHLKDAGLL